MGKWLPLLELQGGELAGKTRVDLGRQSIPSAAFMEASKTTKLDWIHCQAITGNSRAISWQLVILSWVDQEKK